MTDKELEKIEIHRYGGKLKPNNYLCDITDQEMTLLGYETLPHVVKMIYTQGVKLGVRVGKFDRSRQIMVLLNNKDL